MGKRFRNRIFLLSLVSQVVLLLQLILAFAGQHFGLNFTITDDMVSGFMGIVNLFLSILSLMGIVVDPTTPGIKDEE